MFSPEELATAKATDVITGVGAKAEGQQFGETDKITIDPKAEGSSFAQQPQIEEGGLYRKPGEITVYKMEGGSLRPLTGDWNEDTLKQSTGKGYSAVQEITNFGQSPIGSEIKATSTPTIVKPEPIKPTQTSQGFASIVDYLKSTGQDASFESRKKLYKQQGLGEELDFSGTSEQNVSLLKSFEI